MQIQHANRRSWINLGTANRAQAALEARKLYEELRANGWQETLRRRKPDDPALAKKASATIGEYLEAVKAKSALYVKTVEGYAVALRKIAADIHALSDTAEKKSPILREAWRAKVNAIKLRTLRTEKIENWRVDFIRRKGINPVKEKSARVRQTVFCGARVPSSRARSSRASATLWIFPIPLPSAASRLRRCAWRAIARRSTWRSSSKAHAKSLRARSLSSSRSFCWARWRAAKKRNRQAALECVSLRRGLDSYRGDRVLPSEVARFRERRARRRRAA